MAICKWCNQEMRDSKTITCRANNAIEYADGTRSASTSYHFDEKDGRCHDCNIEHGGKHHPGCDVERCPKCEGQLISCNCLLKE